MSMYAMLFGRNEAAPFLMKLLNIDQENNRWSSGRFRDAFLNENGTEIHVYTRNGGGNREHWDDEQKEGDTCSCYACAIEYCLPQHPQYLGDEDDDFDSTYATIRFKVPDVWLDVTKAMATGEKPGTVSDKFIVLFEKVKTGKQDEETERFMEVGKGLMSQINDAIDSGESKVIEV